MKTVTLHVPMSARDALLLPRGMADGHRGVWFYDPTVLKEGPIDVGDTVVFVSGGSEIAKVVVVKEGRGNVELPEGDFVKYCSRINGKVFAWVDANAIPKHKSPVAQKGSEPVDHSTAPYTGVF